MKNKFKLILTFLIGLLVLASVNAFAEVPAPVEAALTAVQTDGLALINLVWPVVAAITGGFVLFKLFKRGASKI